MARDNSLIDQKIIPIQLVDYYLKPLLYPNHQTMSERESLAKSKTKARISRYMEGENRTYLYFIAGQRLYEDHPGGNIHQGVDFSPVIQCLCFHLSPSTHFATYTKH